MFAMAALERANVEALVKKVKGVTFLHAASFLAAM
jgi:hypothetical protein